MDGANNKKITKRIEIKTDKEGKFEFLIEI